MGNIRSYAIGSSNKVLILSSARAKNLGDIAILKGYVKLLKKVSSNMEITVAHSMIEHPNIPGISIRKHPLRQFSQAPTPIIAFGSFIYMVYHLLKRIFYDFGSHINGFNNPYTEYDLIINAHAGVYGERELFRGIFDTISMFFLTNIFTSRMIVGPISVMGPFRSKRARAVLKFVYNKADLIFVRENISKKILIDIGIPEYKVLFLQDMAFWLDPCSPQRAKEILALENISLDKPLVAVIPNYDLFRIGLGKVSQKKEYGESIKSVARLIDDIFREARCMVLLIPFQRYNGKADEKACQDIIELVNKEVTIMYIKNDYEPEEMKGLFGYCELVVSFRLHPSILATSMGTPALIIAADRQRSRGIFAKRKSFSKSIIYVQDMKDNQEFQSIMKKRITYAWFSRNSIRGELNRERPNTAHALSEAAAFMALIIKYRYYALARSRD